MVLPIRPPAGKKSYFQKSCPPITESTQGKGSILITRL